MNIIINLVVLLLLASCQYYTDFWVPSKKINLSDRKLYGNSKFCGHIFLYDIHYPLCLNQKCKKQWNKYLFDRSQSPRLGKDKITQKLNWNSRLELCREKKIDKKLGSRKKGVRPRYSYFL